MTKKEYQTKIREKIYKEIEEMLEEYDLQNLGMWGAGEIDIMFGHLEMRLYAKAKKLKPGFRKDIARTEAMLFSAFSKMWLHTSDIEECYKVVNYKSYKR